MERLIDIVMHPVSQVALMFSSMVLIVGLIVTAPTDPTRPVPQTDGVHATPAALMAIPTPSSWLTAPPTTEEIATATLMPMATWTATQRPTFTPTPSRTAWPTWTSVPTATQMPRPTVVLPTAPVDNPSLAVCPCFGGDALSCKDFATHNAAQACHDYCVAQGVGDVHRLDGNDQDGLACESLP